MPRFGGASFFCRGGRGFRSIAHRTIEFAMNEAAAEAASFWSLRLTSSAGKGISGPQSGKTGARVMTVSAKGDPTTSAIRAYPMSVVAAIASLRLTSCMVTFPGVHAKRWECAIFAAKARGQRPRPGTDQRASAVDSPVRRAR